MQINTKSCVAAAVLVGLVFCSSAFAQSVSYSAAIPVTQVYTGWHSDTWGIGNGGVAITNPANCSATDAYYSDGTDPGNKNYLAQALTAFSNGAHVIVIVSNTTCTQNRPTIYGLVLQP